MIQLWDESAPVVGVAVEPIGELHGAPWCWSPSQLEDVDRCDRYAWLRRIAKLKDPRAEKPDRVQRRQLGQDVHALLLNNWVAQDPVMVTGPQIVEARRLAQPARHLLPVRGSFLGEMKTLPVEFQPKPELLTVEGVQGSVILDLVDFRARERGKVPLVSDIKLSKTSRYDLAREQLGWDIQLLTYAEGAARYAEAQGVEVTAIELQHVHIYTEGEAPRTRDGGFLPDLMNSHRI